MKDFTVFIYCACTSSTFQLLESVYFKLFIYESIYACAYVVMFLTNALIYTSNSYWPNVCVGRILVQTFFDKFCKQSM